MRVQKVKQGWVLQDHNQTDDNFKISGQHVTAIHHGNWYKLWQRKVVKLNKYLEENIKPYLRMSQNDQFEKKAVAHPPFFDTR